MPYPFIYRPKIRCGHVLCALRLAARSSVPATVTTCIQLTTGLRKDKRKRCRVAINADANHTFACFWHDGRLSLILTRRRVCYVLNGDGVLFLQLVRPLLRYVERHIEQREVHWGFRVLSAYLRRTEDGSARPFATLAGIR